MTSICEIFCGVFLLLYILQPAYSFSSRTFVGKYFISNQELKTIKVQDWMGCLKHCHEEPLCISYNFDKGLSKRCVLNKHGIEDFIYADSDLVDDAGWIFHQLKPVTKRTNKSRNMIPCQCNCGSSNQCYPPPPGLGDVPEKAAGSCEKILEQRRQAQDGAYYLQASPSYKVYCQMTPISDCGDKGGWTLVMKINGSKSTFSYNGRYWKEQDAYYQERHGGDLSEKETKLKTFQFTNFHDMCLGMKTLNGIKWVKIALQGKQNMEMFPIFRDDHNQFGFIEIPKEKWEGLVDEATLDDSSKKSGFNIKSYDKAKVRIGILASKSYIGFGTGGAMANISCGYVRTDTNKVQPTFGYILIR